MASRPGPACCIALALLLVGGCGPDSPGGGAAPLRVFGRTGLGPVEFAYPRAMAIARDQRHLLIVDKAGRIQTLSESGDFVRAWRMPEIDAGKPTGLGVAPDGRVFVAETHYGRVAIFSPEGELLSTFGSFGREPGQFILPTDVEVAADGRVFVAEYGGNDRVSCFSADLQWQYAFADRASGDGATARPQGLCLARDGTLLVADSCNHRIARYALDGRFLGAFGTLGSERGELRFPYSVDEMADGSIVVAEFGNNRVQRFSATGDSLGVWGRPGREPGELAYPWACGVLADGRLAVLDSGNNRVQILDGRAARTWR
ncbi:MAG: hypothetical protein IPM64_13950 [Phycisphaerales bacterium]|nr:hypothetical protein [Phycisphaerales bacterium]